MAFPKFYDADPTKTNPKNQNATLAVINLTADLWTEDGKYKANLSRPIEFEADSWFTDAYELIVKNGETETKLIENTDFFVGDPDVELGATLATTLFVKLQDTVNVRKARTGELFLIAWVARQKLKADTLNSFVATIERLSKLIEG